VGPGNTAARGKGDFAECDCADGGDSRESKVERLHGNNELKITKSNFTIVLNKLIAERICRLLARLLSDLADVSIGLGGLHRI